MTSAASGNVLCSRVYRVARSIIFNVLENDQAGRSPPLCSRSDIAAHCYPSNWFAGTPVDDNTAAFIAAVHAPTMEPRHFGSSPAWNLEPSTLLCTAAPPPRTINYRISPKAGASPLRLPVASCSPLVTRAGLAQIWNFLGLAHYLVAENSSSKPSKRTHPPLQHFKISWTRTSIHEAVPSTDSVCSPTPAAFPHLTAKSGDPGIFGDGFQPEVLELQVKIFYGFILSLVISIFHYILVMLVYLLTVEYLESCNRFNPFDI